MAYSAPSTISTGDLITAAKWNADVSANPIAIYAGAMSVASQAVGDILYASSTTQFARVAAVATGQVLASAGTGTVPAYSATPALTSVDMGGTTVYGSRAITVDTGGVLNVVLSSSAGDDFTVDTDKLVVSGDSGAVGIGTAAPVSLLDVRGPTGTGATPAGLLTLATAELTVVDNDQLGRINFQAPLESSGSDAILAAASIYAEATATFSATVNSTDIVFATATDAAVVEHLRLDSRGTMRYGYEGTGKGTLQNESWGTVWGNNTYYNGSAWVAVATAASSNITQGSTGDIIFRSAPSVSAGASTSAVDNVTITTAGLVAIGGSPDTYAAVTLRTAFTSSGSSSVARGFDTDRMTVTAVSGDTTHVVGSLFSAAMTVPDVSETFVDVSQVMIDEPAITKGAAATITNASSLKITGAPSEATNNYALWVDAGVSRFDGDVYSAAYTAYFPSSTVVGWSSFATSRAVINYKTIGKLVFVWFHLEGESNATTVSFTLPYTSTAVGFGNMFHQTLNFTYDNTLAIATPGQCGIDVNTNTATCDKTCTASGGWTASGSKIVSGQFTYEMA